MAAQIYIPTNGVGGFLLDSTLKVDTQDLTYSVTQGGSDLPADLGEPPEKQEAPGIHLGDIDTGGSHFRELVLLPGHWCWQVPF